MGNSAILPYWELWHFCIGLDFEQKVPYSIVWDFYCVPLCAEDSRGHLLKHLLSLKAFRDDAAVVDHGFPSRTFARLGECEITRHREPTHESKARCGVLLRVAIFHSAIRAKRKMGQKCHTGNYGTFTSN